MNFREFLKREKHIVLNAQPFLFRVIKWIIILVIATILYLWKGAVIALSFFVILMVLGTSLHFLLRWKTKGWTQSWGPYKRIPLNDN